MENRFGVGQFNIYKRINRTGTLVTHMVCNLCIYTRMHQRNQRGPTSNLLHPFLPAVMAKSHARALDNIVLFTVVDVIFTPYIDEADYQVSTSIKCFMERNDSKRLMHFSVEDIARNPLKPYLVVPCTKLTPERCERDSISTWKKRLV